MEVPGKLEIPPSTVVCIPCNRDGLKEPAYGFCQNCQEHLCETCFKHHKRARPLRNHVLLDKDSMPKMMASATPDDTTDLCSKHKDKTLEFYCNTHKCVACYVCVTLEHKNCHVDYIPDVSGEINDEIQNMFKQMESLLKKCKTNIETADKISQNLDQCHKKVVEDIKLFRKEINKCLDQMETKVISDADAFVKKSRYEQDVLKDTSAEISKDIEQMVSLLNRLRQENKLTKLFIETKNAEKQMQALSKKEKEVEQVNKADDKVKFIRNTDLLDTLKTDNIFGQLLPYGKPSSEKSLEVQFSDTINVQSKSNENECNITGIVIIAPSKIIVADYGNENIKMIDTESNIIVAEQAMSSSPSDVITLPGNKVAVNLELQKCIQILSYKDTSFSLCNRLEVGAKCNGVAYCKDRFVVCCFFEKKVIILNNAGVTLNVLNIRAILNGPLKVLISNDEKFLYISDRDRGGKSKVIKIDWEGNVKDLFEEQGYNYPYGLQQLADGTLLVCYSNSDKLLRLSSSLKRCDVTGLEDTDLYTPKALKYCDRDQKLYVSCSSKKGKWQADIVKVFDIKWKT